MEGLEVFCVLELIFWFENVDLTSKDAVSLNSNFEEQILAIFPFQT